MEMKVTLRSRGVTLNRSSRRLRATSRIWLLPSPTSFKGYLIVAELRLPNPQELLYKGECVNAEVPFHPNRPEGKRVIKLREGCNFS
jgi:hypothetical protein